MRLKQFKAKNIHGYIDMIINFNDELSILIGGNGSGKTSALKLMQALISPSFEVLFTTEFDEISLSFVIGSNINTIYCLKTKEIIELRVNGIDEKLTIENIEVNEIEYLSNSKRKSVINEKIKELPLEYRKHPVIEFITKIKSPIFLGLERKYERDSLKDENIYYNEISYSHESYYKNIKNRRLYDGNLSIGLSDAQFLVQESYKIIKRYDERNIIKMREELLSSSFKYREFDVIEFNESLSNWKEKKELLEKKDEIIEVLSKIDRKEKVLTKELLRFFSRLEILLEELDEEEEKKIDIELVVNMAQIDKIFELVEIMESHKKKTEQMYSKFYKFIKIINDFYSDSDKSVEIDTLGRIKIRRPNDKYCPISALSSGERQLLVIFAHAFFNNNSKEEVFIIDEPELSLHLRWQQIFISTIMDNCPNTQFIMATHSPDIVDEYDDSIILEWRK